MSSEMDRPLAESRWRRWRWPAVVAVVLSLVAMLVLANIGDKRTIRLTRSKITIATVDQSRFIDRITARGSIEPKDVVYIDLADGGSVERILARSGDVVEKDQPLVEFGNTDLQLQVIQQESQINQAISQLQTNEIQLEQSSTAAARALVEIEYEIRRLQDAVRRLTPLANTGSASREQLQTTQEQLGYYQRLQPIQAQSNQRQADLRSRLLPGIHDQQLRLRANLLTVRSKLDALIVRAPVKGVLSEFELKIGQNVGRGQRIGKVVPETGYNVVASVDGYYAGYVEKGLAGELYDGADPAALIVERVDPQVKNGSFAVDLAFAKQPSGRVLPGQAVQVRLNLSAARQAVVLPVGPFMEQTAGRWVFVLARDGESAVRRNLTIGRRNEQELEVLSGLRAGDRVIISDYEGLDSYESIRLRD